jgi:hypothetical protein
MPPFRTSTEISPVDLNCSVGGAPSLFGVAWCPFGKPTGFYLMPSNGRGSHRAIARGKSCDVAIATALLLASGAALAEDKEKEPHAILELGAAGAWDVNGGSTFDAVDGSSTRHVSAMYVGAV